MAPLRTGDGFADVVVTAVASTTPLAPDAEDTWQRYWRAEAASACSIGRSSESSNRRCASAGSWWRASTSS